MKLGTVYWRGPWKLDDRGEPVLDKKGERIPDVSNGGSWWIQYYENGKQHAESAESKVKEHAKALLRKRLNEITAGTFIAPKDRKVTIGELIEDLLKYYRGSGKKQKFADDTESRWTSHLKPRFENVRAEQLSTTMMQTYRAKRLQDKPAASQTTVNRELQVIRKALKYAAGQEPPKVKFVPRFEMASELDNPRKVFMTEEVKQKLKDAAARESLWMRVFVEMVFTLGWVKAGRKDGYIIHDTRRTAARTQRSAGVPETVACEILGWKPGSKMFARYGIVDRADMAEALKRQTKWEKEQAETTTKPLQLAADQ